MSPGAPERVPGLHTAMKNDNASERAAALVNQALDVLQRAGRAPASPVNAFLRAKARREFRRGAARLRAGKSEPRYRNLHTAGELAEVYERTARRDEILERAVMDFRRITFELGRVLDENDLEVRTALDALIEEIKRSAEKNGPGSEAAERYRQLQFLAWFGQKSHSHRRRQRAPAPRRLLMAPDPSVEARHQLCAIEILDSAPAGETVMAIPPEGKGTGRGRMFIRVGTGASRWTGSFERGHERVSTAAMMPDGEHLFVSAEGAGYILEAKSRALVEQTGTDVVGVMRDEPPTLFVVNHDDVSLEAFGRSGRLWKTGPIGSGGLRDMALTDHALVGEARQSGGTGWVGFRVDLATGEVRVGEGDR